MLVNSFTYLQPNSHTIPRNWFYATRFCACSQPLCLALLEASQEREALLRAEPECPVTQKHAQRAETERNQRNAPNQEHEFYNHFTIFKFALPHKAHYARLFFLLLFS